MFIFETNRLAVRQYVPSDFEIFFKMSSDKELMQYIRPTQTREECRIFFDNSNADYLVHPQLGRWALLNKTDASIVGSFAVIPVKESDEIQIGYLLLKECWGKGYATEAAQGGIHYCFETLQLKTIVAITEVPNVASQKVLQRCGFLFEKEFSEKEIELNFYRLNNSRIS